MSGRQLRRGRERADDGSGGDTPSGVERLERRGWRNGRRKREKNGRSTT